ncbi:Septal ring factor EnvC, activator of murein hydrolases AmiA and AmiB [Azotobacter beijerinckii]|uniref:Septal ring factor EnvC, activator of murein hydrolases AmiA and AmiB n=1 Tax=Azotobacter beijerinckii TaxID=170623 RepID=A0A1H6TW71_9GAMM|nr:murein hydrolase activator EnvC [Azotobacter beijerinckii]SEI84293.1 Septal ring factor EnvC, activator of murein hydrolases AmiA and AmiB [Azotobacter beijerinckii]
MHRTLSVLILALILGPAFADERSETLQQLEQARQEIAELKKLQEQLNQERSAVQKALGKTEREMGDLERQVRELQEEQGSRERELRRLDQEKQTLQDARDEQQRLIAIQARAAYQNGRQEYLKLLLNQQQPERLSRTLTYYGYLNQARRKQLETFDATLSQLATVEQDIATQQVRLGERKSELEQRRGRLAEVRAERRQVLARLGREYASSARQLETREEERAELVRVLQRIEETLARQAREATEARQRALAEQRRQQELAQRQRARSAASATETPLLSSADVAPDSPFAKARGSLPWPVDGRLLAPYGSPRSEDARARWDGVLIGASAGSPVHAIHAGRVVFADWLRGSGLLVILDHGNGYLSLYGHNESLLKGAGDMVKAGEPIATVGTSGGQDMPALYFAIRHQGRPTDPALWCRAQG